MARIKVLGGTSKSKGKAKPRQVRVTAADVAEARANKNRDNSPKWDGCESFTTAQFASAYRNAMRYYNLECSAKELKPAVLKWMAANGFDKKQVEQFKKSKDWRCSSTMGAIASCLLKGMQPVRPDFNKGRDISEWLRGRVNRVLEESLQDSVDEPIKEANPTALVVSIQDRTRETALEMTSEIEDALESFYSNKDTFDPKSFKVINSLRGKGVKPAHARIIKELYAFNFNELKTLASGKADPQLREGYSHLARKYVNKLIDFYQEVMSACDMIIEEAKVTRKPRTVKEVSKDKLVAKLKYSKQDTTLKLVSINPVDIIGAKELWFYDTHIRKLGKYVAAEFSQLGVKGTTITGFDENASVQKSLRKPAEQLAAFKAAGKVALRKFLDEINTVDTKLTGRMNEHIILLKVA